MAKTKAKIACEVRKRKQENGLKRVQVYVSDDTHYWLKSQPECMAQVIENLVKEKTDGI